MSTQLWPQHWPDAAPGKEHDCRSRAPAQLVERHAAVVTMGPGWVQTSPAGQLPAVQGALHWPALQAAPWAQVMPQPPQFRGSPPALQPSAQQKPMPPSGPWQSAP